MSTFSKNSMEPINQDRNHHPVDATCGGKRFMFWLVRPFRCRCKSFQKMKKKWQNKLILPLCRHRESPLFFAFVGRRPCLDRVTLFYLHFSPFHSLSLSSFSNGLDLWEKKLQEFNTPIEHCCKRDKKY